ncbi:MAG: hypothetical protein ACI9O3_001133, partial [Colwellia sp.]
KRDLSGVDMTNVISVKLNRDRVNTLRLIDERTPN